MLSPSARPGRRAIVAAILGLSGLAACGFTPAYAPGGTGRLLDRQVAIETPATPMGARLRDRLLARLGAGGSRFRLVVSLTTRQESAAASGAGAQARIVLVGEAQYRLTEGDRVLTEGRVQEMASYSTTGSSLATRAAATDAEARLAVLLADRIMTRLLALPPPGP